MRARGDVKPYLTPGGCGEAEFSERRSRFIGRVWPVSIEEEALAHIKSARERHWDATHNVYAYSIRNTGAARYSDDGEPQGTAGIPVFDVFRKGGVTDFCCVVTRYFGGILLGAGGLVRAYSQAAKLALDAAGILTMRLWAIALVACPYPLLELLKLEIRRLGGVIEDIEYGADAVFRVALPAEMRGEFGVSVSDLSSGRAEALFVEERFMGL